MFKVKTFRTHWSNEELLGQNVEYFLNENHILRENIVDIKYAVNDDCIYCMLIWEDN